MEESTPADAPAPRLHIAYPPGLSPDKWLRRMAERHPEVRVTASLVDVGEATLPGVPRLLRAGFDVAFAREFASAPRSAPPGLARVPLYEESQAVVVPKGHEATVFAELDPAELAGERWLEPFDLGSASSADVETLVGLVAANVGIAELPLPLARSMSRRDVVVIPLAVPPVTRLGIAWLPERGEDPALEAFAGIVRGRTANTSRTGGAASARGDASGTRAGDSRPRGGASRSRGATGSPGGGAASARGGRKGRSGGAKRRR